MQELFNCANFVDSLMKAETQLIKEALPSFAGTNTALFSNEIRFSTYLNQIGTKNKMLIYPEAVTMLAGDYRACSQILAQQKNGINVMAVAYHNTALATESLDCVVLPHMIETLADPKLVLNEIYRVLNPMGHLLLFSFNPWSLLYLFMLANKLIKPKRNLPAFCYSSSKVELWLKILGFDVLKCGRYLYTFPFNYGDVIGKMSVKMQGVENFCKYFNLPFGASYYILAQKRVAALTVIKPSQQKGQGFLVHDVLNPN